MEKRCSAILVAAGNSLRMGQAKQWIPLLGKPVLQWTLEAFCAAKQVDSIVLVLRKEDFPQAESVAALCRKEKQILLVEGGDSRQASVMAGASAADGDWLVIHDGARCLITPEKIDAVIQDAVQLGASALAVPVKDTVKLVTDQQMVEATPDRRRLWAVQTPQVFPRETYLKVAQKACREGREYTDDCQLWEYENLPVHLCVGEYENIKLTTVEDVPLAEIFLRKRMEG